MDVGGVGGGKMALKAFDDVIDVGGVLVGVRWGEHSAGGGGSRAVRKAILPEAIVARI